MPITVPTPDSCSFCDNFRGVEPWHGPPAVVHDRDGLYVIMAPAALGGMPGHTLVIPRRHVPTLFDMTPEEYAALGAMVFRVARAVRSQWDPAGLVVSQLNGVPARQSVPHVHVHVIPVRAGFEWPPVAEVPITPHDVRQEQAAQLRGALGVV